MIIPISDDFRIEGTRYAWEVQRASTRKHRKTGKHQTHWVPIQWYATLPSAMQGLAELRLRVAEAETIADAINVARSLATDLGNALAAIGGRSDCPKVDGPSK
jgi:hypothetical protein